MNAVGRHRRGRRVRSRAVMPAPPPLAPSLESIGAVIWRPPPQPLPDAPTAPRHPTVCLPVRTSGRGGGGRGAIYPLAPGRLPPRVVCRFPALEYRSSVAFPTRQSMTRAFVSYLVRARRRSVLEVASAPLADAVSCPDCAPAALSAYLGQVEAGQSGT